MEFRYRSGEIVKIGDVVRTASGATGIVEAIYDPGSEGALAFYSPEGCVLISTNPERTAGVVLTPDDLDWDDTILLERGRE